MSVGNGTTVAVKAHSLVPTAVAGVGEGTFSFFLGVGGVLIVYANGFKFCHGYTSPVLEVLTQGHFAAVQTVDGIHEEDEKAVAYAEYGAGKAQSPDAEHDFEHSYSLLSNALSP